MWVFVVAVMTLLAFAFRQWRFKARAKLPKPALVDTVQRRPPPVTEGLRVCVIGGSGNIGARVVKLLRSDAAVNAIIVADVVAPVASVLERTAGDTASVSFVRTDITNAAQVELALAGCQAVVHLASLIDLRRSEHVANMLFNINVVGACNVLNAAVAGGVRALVYTASTAARFQGVHPREANCEVEDDPVTGRNRILQLPPPPNHYGSTKHAAELMVLAADGRGGTLRTCAVAPHAVFGHKDAVYLEPEVVAIVNNTRMPRLVSAAQVGSYAYSYNVDVARGHVLALHALLDATKADSVGGQSFFLLNENKHVDKFLTAFWDLLEAKTKHRKLNRDDTLDGVPAMLVRNVAAVVDWFTKGTLRWQWLNLGGDVMPFVLGDHTYSNSKAQRVLGFQPVPLERAMNDVVDEMIADGTLEKK